MNHAIIQIDHQRYVNLNNVQQFEIYDTYIRISFSPSDSRIVKIGIAAYDEIIGFIDANNRNIYRQLKIRCHKKISMNIHQTMSKEAIQILDI